MKIIIIILMILLAAGSFVIGMITENDPQGHGDDITVRAWLIALAAMLGAVWIGVGL